MAGTHIKNITMYTASIVSAKINKGLLSVEVTFSDGEDTFNDTFETNQSQSESWLDEQIERKLNHLNSILRLKESINIGNYQPGKPKPKTDRDIYFETRMTYLNYMNEARTGPIKYDRPIIKELLEWLRANFKDEYMSAK